MSDLKTLIEKYSNEARIANANDRIFKDECVYSFNTSEHQDGLYVCLKTFIGVSREFLGVHFRKTQSHIYLNIKTERKEIVEDKENSEPETKKKPTKLGLGIDGGFDLKDKQFYFEHSYALFLWPEDKFVKLPENEGLLSDRLKSAVDALIAAESITYKEELASQVQAWDGEQRLISKHAATLKQLPNAPQVPPSGWKCSKCDKRDNLWLNLTDGAILCGRRQLDGSGGNNHAIEYYTEKRFPLAVKLGTITADGKADIYSYDEDDMVEDPNLAVHLAHFGINVRNMEKTEKTMAELEIDLNQKLGEWDVIQETGANLRPLYGPSFTGMRNLGNSCYMNSVIQLLFSIPEFQEKYFLHYLDYFKAAPQEPSQDFNLQMAKLAYGLLSGKYSVEPSSGGLEELNRLAVPKGIKPHSFKQLIGRGHVEFSTKRQQDAHEFFEHVITQLDRNHHQEKNADPRAVNPADCFRFEFEDRIQCIETNQVRYVKRVENSLSLLVSLDLTLNKEEVQQYELKKKEAEKRGEKLDPTALVRPRISLLDCLQLLTKPELITDFHSSATRKNSGVLKAVSFATFPDYLFIQMRKFTLAPDWTPMKLDVAIEAPDVIDINQYRGGSGLKAGEVELRDDTAAAVAPAVQINEDIVAQLMDMGFSLDGSKRAAYNTRELNDAEAAVNWAMAHMEDADFNNPFDMPRPRSAASVAAASAFKADEVAIESIMCMGFTRQQAIKALKETSNNLERAADWIFSHTDELMNIDENEPQEVAAAPSQAKASNLRNGDGRYELVAFVSHMGTNANVGHYVVHIKKENKWCIFNDQNVMESEKPHKELAYCYLYRRI